MNGHSEKRKPVPRWHREPELRFAAVPDLGQLVINVPRGMALARAMPQRPKCTAPPGSSHARFSPIYVPSP
jgi:hypothetical protein